MIIVIITIIKTDHKEEEHDFQSFHINRFKCSLSPTHKNPKTCKESGKYGPFKGKINHQKLFLMADLLHKDFKTSALKMLRELRKMWIKPRK